MFGWTAQCTKTKSYKGMIYLFVVMTVHCKHIQCMSRVHIYFFNDEMAQWETAHFNTWEQIYYNDESHKTIYMSLTDLLHEPYRSITWALQICYMSLTDLLHEPYRSLQIYYMSLTYPYRSITWALQIYYMSLTDLLHEPYRSLQIYYMSLTDLLHEPYRCITWT